MDTDTTALLDPERQFLGCLMQLPLNSVRRLMAGMRASDLADPVAASVLQVAIELLADGHPPAPVAIYTHALATGRAVGDTRRRHLAGWIVDTYRDAPPAVTADHLKTVVLEAAWRRAVNLHALRVLQAVEQCRTDALREITEDTAADELWLRYRSGVGDASGASRLGAVA
jgi:hypothetical protein